MFFDTHIHLKDTIPNYPCVNVSTVQSEWLSILQISKSHPHIIPALGIHPWFVTDSFESQLVHLQNLLSVHPSAVLGEIGLDFSSQYRQSKLLQIEVFSQHLDMAVQFQRPLSLHIVKAHNEALSMLKGLNVLGVVHGFGSSPEVAKRYVDLGFKIGVNAIVCRDNAFRYHRLVRYVPLESLVLETDYPNVRLGSKDANIEDIALVAQSVARIKNVSLQEVIQTTYNTAKYIFGNPHESLI